MSEKKWKKIRRMIRENWRMGYLETLAMVSTLKLTERFGIAWVILFNKDPKMSKREAYEYKKSQKRWSKDSKKG